MNFKPKIIALAFASACISISFAMQQTQQQQAQKQKAKQKKQNTETQPAVQTDEEKAKLIGVIAAQMHKTEPTKPAVEQIQDIAPASITTNTTQTANAVASTTKQENKHKHINVCPICGQTDCGWVKND